MQEQQDKDKYRIGEFTFATFHEYRDGQEDVRKIECINKELDIQNPEVAVRLYNDIREGKIVFRTAIGDQFYAHLADIVADKSVDLLEDKAVVEEAEGKIKYQKYIGLGFIVVAFVCFAVFGIAELRDIYTTRQMKQLAEQVQQSDTTDSQTDGEDETNTADDSDGQSEDITQIETLSVLPEYADLLSQNPEMVGWITIEDTQVNYPVVQKENDNEYYLNHGFDQSNNSNGTIFVDYRCNIVNPTTNTIIYGHNMKSGMMFGELKKYLNDGYLEQHPYIQFNTIYEYRTYQIMAVCLSEVQYQDEATYRYYDFISAGTDQELANFIANVNELAVYGSADGLTKTDKILTLSTCNSYTEDGRLFIIAKQVE
jgi:sortase B